MTIKHLFTNRHIDIASKDRTNGTGIIIPRIQNIRTFFFEEGNDEIISPLSCLPNQDRIIFYNLLVEVDKKYQYSYLIPEFALRYTGIPYKQFYEKFRKITGTTFNDYIILLRTYKAGYLLLNSTIPVEKVSYDCGVGTLSNFRKMVRAGYGMSPRELRARK